MSLSAATRRSLERLSAADSTHRRQLATLIAAQLLDTRIDAMVQLDPLLDMVMAAVTAPNAARLIERHVGPGRQRFTSHVIRTGDRPSDLVSPALMPRIEEIVKKARLPKGKWAQDAVDTAALRQLFAPVIQDTLLNFAKRLPIPGVTSSGAGGGHSSASQLGSSVAGGFGFLRDKVKAEVEKRAGGLVDAAREKLGELNAEVERKFQMVAREFSTTAQADIEAAVASRLKSDEGKALLGRIRLQVFKKFMATAIHELDADTNRLPWDDILAIAPEVAAWAIQRPNVKTLLRTEITAILAVEGARTLRELLDEAGITEHVERWLTEQTDGQIQRLAATDAFGVWLNELLKA
jgi:hypothetical protein